MRTKLFMYFFIKNYIGTQGENLLKVLYTPRPTPVVYAIDHSKSVVLVLFLLCVTGRFMFASLFVLVFFSVLLALWSPRLGKREVVCVLLVHLFVYFTHIDFCSSFLPLGVGGWLRLVIVALPGIFY